MCKSNGPLAPAASQLRTRTAAAAADGAAVGLSAGGADIERQDSIIALAVEPAQNLSSSPSLSHQLLSVLNAALSSAGAEQAAHGRLGGPQPVALGPAHSGPALRPYRTSAFRPYGAASSLERCSSAAEMPAWPAPLPLLTLRRVQTAEGALSSMPGAATTAGAGQRPEHMGSPGASGSSSTSPRGATSNGSKRAREEAGAALLRNPSAAAPGAPTVRASWPAPKLRRVGDGMATPFAPGAATPQAAPSTGLPRPAPVLQPRGSGELGGVDLWGSRGPNPAALPPPTPDELAWAAQVYAAHWQRKQQGAAVSPPPKALAILRAQLLRAYSTSSLDRLGSTESQQLAHICLPEGAHMSTAAPDGGLHNRAAR